MSAFDFFVWIVVNISVPVLAPLVFPLALKVSPKTRPYAKGLVLKSIADGQLFWVVIALCAVESYELFGYLDEAPKGWPHNVAVFAIWFHIILIGFSMILVLCEALDLPPMAKKEQDGAVSPARDRTVLKWSIGSTILVAVTFTFAHYVVASSDKAKKDAILCELAKAKGEHECDKLATPAEK